MKKTVLCLFLVLTVCVACISLSACNNATPQGQLGNYFSKYEKYVYDVYDSKTSSNGIYELEIKAFTEEKNTVELSSGFTLENQTAGHLITSKLTINDYTYVTACYYANVSGNTYYLPKGSYKLVEKGGNKQYDLKTTYSSDSKKGYADYVLSETGKDQQKGSLELKTPYYDNLEFYTMLRGASTMDSGFSMSYNVAIVAPNEINTATISANCSSTEKVNGLPTNVFADGQAESYKVTISRSTKVAGLSYTVYYAKSSVKKIDDVDVRPLVRIITTIVEGDVTYTLKSVSASNV